MAIQEVVRSLQLEKRQGVESRFPCRAIMVKTIDQYCTLLEELKKISECEVVPIEVLFSSYDVMPDYEQLKDPEYRDKWIILTGVSEYLRLFSKSEAENGRFASLWHHQVSSESKGRILIPLWGCWVQWNDTSLNLTSDIRQDDFLWIARITMMNQKWIFWCYPDGLNLMFQSWKRNNVCCLWA